MTGVLFDLDGVLVETRPIHREALSRALEPHTVIPPGEEPRFEGLPTRVKLDMLADEGRIPREAAPDILAAKQTETVRVLCEQIRPDAEKRRLFASLRKQDISIAVVSNAVPHTVGLVLQLLELHPDLIVTNEDAPRPKPYPDPYIVAMYELGLKPAHTLIVEDAPVGIEAAKASGAHVLEVTGPDEVTTERVMGALP